MTEPLKAPGEGQDNLPLRELPMRGMRAAIAATMTHSLSQMAQFTLHRHVDVSAVQGLRPADGESPLRIIDALMYAVAQGLKKHPEVNATLEDNVIREWTNVHLGVAVALDAGLVVPVVRNADRMTPEELGAAVRVLSTRARAGKISMDDLAGGTFTVTNLGPFNIDLFTPIVNPPQVGILGVGRTVDSLMSLSLTVDHRALDGAPAALFLATVSSILEDPERLRDSMATQ